MNLRRGKTDADERVELKHKKKEVEKTLQELKVINARHDCKIFFLSFRGILY